MTYKKLKKTANIFGSSRLNFKVLNEETANKHYSVEYYEPSAHLSFFIEMHWVMRWRLPESQSFQAQIVPSAYTNLTCMKEGARITGVTTGRYDYKIKGEGVIFGIMFKPAGIRAFYQNPIKQITDKHIPAQKAIEGLTEEFSDKVLSSDDKKGLLLLEELMSSLNLIHDPNIDLLNEIISFAHKENTVSIAKASRHFAMSERKLQSLFENYVGVGLKWIMLRHRLLNATVIAGSSRDKNWSLVAYELGYSDQSHFINDFKKITGLSPSKYSKSLQSS